MKPDPLAPPRADLGVLILGIWRLRSREDYDRGGRRLIDPVLGPDPLGILCFSPEHFAAQFMNRSRGTNPAAPAVAPSAGGAAPMGANNTSAVGGYDAYFGRYALDARAGTIAVTLEGALAPANIGMTATREVRVNGDELQIRLDTNAADGTPITRTLTFDRLFPSDSRP